MISELATLTLRFPHAYASVVSMNCVIYGIFYLTPPAYEDTYSLVPRLSELGLMYGPHKPPGSVRVTNRWTQ